MYSYESRIFRETSDKLFEKATEAFGKLSGEIKHASPDELFINQSSFVKKALDKLRHRDGTIKLRSHQ